MSRRVRRARRTHRGWGCSSARATRSDLRSASRVRDRRNGHGSAGLPSITRWTRLRVRPVTTYRARPECSAHAARLGTVAARGRALAAPGCQDHWRTSAWTDANARVQTLEAVLQGTRRRRTKSHDRPRPSLPVPRVAGLARGRGPRAHGPRRQRIRAPHQLPVPLGATGDGMTRPGLHLLVQGARAGVLRRRARLPDRGDPLTAPDHRPFLLATDLRAAGDRDLRVDPHVGREGLYPQGGSHAIRRACCDLLARLDRERRQARAGGVLRRPAGTRPAADASASSQSSGCGTTPSGYRQSAARTWSAP